MVPVLLSFMVPGLPLYKVVGITGVTMTVDQQRATDLISPLAYFTLCS